MVVNLVFGNHGGRCILCNHETGADAAVLGQEGRQTLGQCRIHQALRPTLGNIRKFRNSDLQEVEGQRHGLSVEVPAADYFILIREYNRIIRYCIDFP